MIAVPFPSPFDGSERLRGFRWGVVFRGDPPRTPRMDWAHTGGRWDRTARSAKRKKAVINRSVFASSAAPWGWRGRAIGVGGRSGDAIALYSLKSAKVRRDGVKDAGETGAGAATTGREGGDSSECDRLADFLGHKALLCVTQSGRRMDWWVGGRRRGPIHRGSCESGCRCWGESEHNGSCG